MLNRQNKIDFICVMVVVLTILFTWFTYEYIAISCVITSLISFVHLLLFGDEDD